MAPQACRPLKKPLQPRRTATGLLFDVGLEPLHREWPLRAHIDVFRTVGFLADMGNCELGATFNFFDPVSDVRRSGTFASIKTEGVC